MAQRNNAGDDENNRHDFLHFFVELRSDFLSSHINQLNSLQNHVGYDAHVNLKHRGVHTGRYERSPEIIPTTDLNDQN